MSALSARKRFPTSALGRQPYLKELAIEQGLLLHEQEDRVAHAYFPASGMISLLTVMGDGRAIETATVGREGAVGAMSGLGPAHAASRAVVQVAGTASIRAGRFGGVKRAPRGNSMGQWCRCATAEHPFMPVRTSFHAFVSGCNTHRIVARHGANGATARRRLGAFSA